MRNPNTTKAGITGRAAAIGGVLLFAAFVSGCSSSSTTEPSGTSRSLSEIFSGTRASYAQTTPAANATEFDPADCPPVDIRQGASTYSVNTASKNPEEAVLRYQGSFSQTARSCSRAGTTMTIKLGIQGRIILGAGGTPGQVDVPIRFALVEEGVQPKTVWTKFYQVPVTIGEGQPSVTFTHIEDDLTVPMPDKGTLEAYVVYIGFDPLSAASQGRPKKTPPRPGRPKVNG